MYHQVCFLRNLFSTELCLSEALEYRWYKNWQVVSVQLTSFLQKCRFTVID